MPKAKYYPQFPGLDRRAAAKLDRAGIQDVDHLRRMGRNALISAPTISGKTVDTILKWLETQDG